MRFPYSFNKMDKIIIVVPIQIIFLVLFNISTIFLILLLNANMSRMLKDPKSIGKLSTRRLSLFQQPQNKKISAVLPRMSVKMRKDRISHSALLAEGKEDPLPHIKTGTKPLRTKAKSAKNPEEEICFVDSSRKKIGHCIAVQMNSPRHSQAGKFYNPSMQLIASPGKIRHQNSSYIDGKPPLQQTIKNFKNFLQNKYVQEMQEKRKGVTIIEYDRRFGDSVGSTANLEKARYEPQEQIMPICSQGPYRSFYLSTSLLRMKEVFLKDEGSSFVPCGKQEYTNPSQMENTAESDHLLFESTSSHNSIQIGLFTTVSRLKQILIEQQNTLHISYIVPNPLRSSLSNLGSQQQMHRITQQIFQQMVNFKPQLVSLKKYGNCILLVAKSPHNSQEYALLWYFTGSFYFGGWANGKRDEGCKNGIGMEYTVNNYIYFGEFASNQRHGYGASKKANGETYVGEWREGQRQGWGKLFQSSGYLSLDGNFQEDAFVGNRLSRVMDV